MNTCIFNVCLCLTCSYRETDDAVFVQNGQGGSRPTRNVPAQFSKTVRMTNWELCMSGHRFVVGEATVGKWK